MALKPDMTAPKAPMLNETGKAIAASLGIAVVVATILTGNPFTATRMAYTDYADKPVPGAAKAPAAAKPAAPAPAAAPAKH